MRTFTLLFTAALLGTSALRAQTVATFDDLTLAHADTFYLNYSASGSDVGFNDGLAHFPCYYDTSFGGYWVNGFAYSNMTDSVTSGYTNQYAAKTAIGYAGSANYVVAYGIGNTVQLRGAAIGKPVSGFYITNSTYAFNSMRDGDAFAKKFGDTTGTGITTGQGTAPDWFKVTIRGYSGGVLGSAEVDFYLADYRFASSDSDYIVNTWKPVSLLALGHVDSLDFKLSSSDNSSFGMNTPAYFCIDEFTTNETQLGVTELPRIAAKVYPNPAADVLYVDADNNELQQLTVLDITGSVVYTQQITAAHTAINTSTFAPGNYVLRLNGTGGTATTRFTK